MLCFNKVNNSNKPVADWSCKNFFSSRSILIALGIITLLAAVLATAFLCPILKANVLFILGGGLFISSVLFGIACLEAKERP